MPLPVEARPLRGELAPDASSSPARLISPPTHDWQRTKFPRVHEASRACTSLQLRTKPEALDAEMVALHRCTRTGGDARALVERKDW